MKHVFVLDENVLIQSNNCRSIESEQDDFDSLDLIIAVMKKCHKIGLTEELIAKYQDWLKKLEKNSGNIPAIRIWMHFLHNRNKHIFCENHLNDLPQGLKHDCHVIEPALFLQGTLVTTDRKLKERWNEWTRSKELKLDIKSPKEATVLVENLGDTAP